MPELPEVEVTRRGLAPAIVGRSVTAVNVRTPKLREPLQDLAALLPGLTLEHLERRAKLDLDFPQRCWREALAPHAYGHERLMAHLVSSGTERP